MRCKNIFFIEAIKTPALAKSQRSRINSSFLCHDAMRVWHQSFRGAWHLYGHSHGRLPDEPAALSIYVGIDTHDYRRWHFDQIRSRMDQKTKKREAQVSAVSSMEIADESEPCILPFKEQRPA
jgi:hypothetical protein